MTTPEPTAIETRDPAPRWRREPYLVFFPLGLALTWGGVSHWLLHALGVLPDYRPVFHAITQIQGFMLSFATGFLMTAIPRRTGTAPPSAVQVVVAATCLLGISVAAWFELFGLSQVFWVVLLFVLVQFAVRRFVSSDAGRRPPNSFIWIPLSLLTGLAGSVLIGAYGALGEEYFALHELGSLFLLQGLFVGLVIGVGGMLIPLLTRGENSRDAAGTSRDRLERMAHLLAWLLLIVSFVIENRYSLRGGLILRAVLTFVVLWFGAGIGRRPSVPGWQRWWVWIAAWMIPLGFAFTAAFPYQKKAGLHVVFIGGFALMAFAVGLHVALSHGGRPDLARSFRWPVLGFGLLMLVALVFRGLVDFDPARFFTWIGLAAAVFLLGTLVWAFLTLPTMWGGRPSGG